MKFNAEVQVEYMVDGFSDELNRLVNELKHKDEAEGSDPEPKKDATSVIDSIYRLTESYVRAKVVAFIPITYARACMEQIYIRYFDELKELEPKSKADVVSHLLKTINSEIDREILRITTEDLEKLDNGRAMDLEDAEDSGKKLDIEMTREDALELLDKLMSHLPDFCAYDISLYYVQKLSIPEIAKRTNVSIERVNKKLDFGRQHIKNQLRIMQSRGEINTFGLSLQKFFDWLVEFEESKDVLNSIKKKLNVDKQNSIDYTKVKQRYKNLLLESYEEDDRMNKALEKRLHPKPDKEAKQEEKNVSTTIVHADADAGSDNAISDNAIIETKTMANPDFAERELSGEDTDSDFDAPGSEMEDGLTEAEPEESKESKEIEKSEDAMTSEDEVVPADDREPAAEMVAEAESEDAMAPADAEETTETKSIGEARLLQTAEIESPAAEEISDAADGNKGISDLEADAADELPEIEQDMQKSEKNTIMLLLLLIGAVGATIVYYLVHLLR